MLGAFLCLTQSNIDVRTIAELVAAAKVVKPGQCIRIAPGTYSGGTHLTDVHGVEGKPIVITAQDPANPPVFKGGGSAIQLSKVSYLQLHNLTITNARDNGLNIDDGGTIDKPSHHIILKNIRVSDLPQGNHDGIKLSGIDHFQIQNCDIQRWGGSGIDMVGCHNGEVLNSTFRDGGSNGVQMKGGTSNIRIAQCRFENSGERGVNLGGSTGIPYFRPSLDTIPVGNRYEAKNLTVQHNTFIGSVAPIAFVGVNGAKVDHNTIIYPKRWAIRILQETATPDFLPCGNGVFSRNLIVFRSDSWASGGVNIGPKTNPASFIFSENFWFCEDNPSRSKPTLPTQPKGDKIGQDPQFVDAATGDYRVKKGSPAEGHGANQKSSPL